MTKKKQKNKRSGRIGGLLKLIIAVVTVCAMFVMLCDVSKSFEGKHIIRHLDLTLPETGRVCFFGPSGCGKTTLLRLILGLEKPDSGVITGRDHLRFACQFQENRLLPWYTIRENLSLTLPRDADPAALLKLVHLEDSIDLLPGELSGGMCRRVSLIRALASPGVLVLDEPLRELDEAMSMEMLELIRQYSENRLLLLVTHDRSQAEKLGCAFVQLTPAADN